LTIEEADEVSPPAISRERLSALPTLPGVYIMKGVEGNVLYVGKAKNLKNRVRSYFSGGDGRYNALFLVRKACDIETIVTEDERQALILENDLIKKYRPRYNIRLKDDKAHLLVRVDLNSEWPRIELVRWERPDGAKYIGPFAFGYELRTMLDVIRNSIPLRTCSDRVLINRVRPCLEFQLKRCAAPCCYPVEKALYQEWVERAVSILEGDSTHVVKVLESQMERASAELRFEEAARIRDQLEVLREATADRPVYSFSNGAQDAIGIHREGTRAELSVLQVRRGRLRNAQTFGFDKIDLPDDELLSSFLSQYYGGGGEIPELIIVPFNLEDVDARAALYSELRGRKVEFIVPERGEKTRLASLAQENARENFLARYGASSKEGDLSLRALKDELGLEQAPRTLECVDISHFQGGSTVASVVHFRDGRPDKARYRHFILKNQEGKPDDFASMKEVVLRHLSKCNDENSIADLIIVDGGKAQLSMALAARESISLMGPQIISLAKKRGRKIPYYARIAGMAERGLYKPERVYVEGKLAPIVLRESSKALHLLERIRDEAHRFAITFHRRLRTKKAFSSPLEGIIGLSSKRRIELLKVFGSVQRLRGATVEEIVERTGIPIGIAKRVKARLELASEEHLDPEPPTKESDL